LKIGQRPDHGSDDAVCLLSDCHRRIEEFLGILTAITNRSEGRALDAAARRQLEAALSYFATAAPRHTADEEDSLFPRLEASSDQGALAALDMIRGLERDHDEAKGHHDVVDQLVRRWILEGCLSDASVRDLKERLARLNALYRAHISVEDHELFPAAARILSANDLQEIGREMAARRSAR